MEWVKTTAKTLPEAIDLALDNLGVDESEAEIVILEEPRPGLFGRVRGTARVEARVRPKAIRPKNERTRNRRSRSDEGPRSRNRTKKRADGNRSDGGERGERNRTRPDSAEDQGRVAAVSGRGDSGSVRAGSGQGSARGQGGSGSESGGRNRRRGGDGGRGDGGRGDGGRGDGGRGDGGRGDGGGRERGRTGSGSNVGEAKPSEGATVEEVAAHLRTFLTDLTEAFGFDGGVSIDDSEEGTIVGRIEGRHGLLVGPKGRTLDAVQELARISSQRTAPSNIRIKVDVGGYREQRAAALGEFARQAADRATADGVEVALEPMSAADRKAVHDALSEDGRVETRSAGAEPRRRVVVVPVESGDTSDDDVDDDDDRDDVDGVPAAAGFDRDGLTEVEDGPEDRPFVDEEE